VSSCNEILKLWKQNPDYFISHLVTGDETWIHHYDPETKQESSVWMPKGSVPPVKAKTVKSAGKIMATIFWDSKAILLTDYLSRGATINGAYYCKVLADLRYRLRNRRRGYLADGIYLLHDNASSYTAKIVKDALEPTGLTVVSHPPYSPDLAPSDFYLFPHLKKALRGKKYQDDSEVLADVQSYFDSLPETFFLKGIEMLIARCKKCILVGGSYVEKA
jgi:histone-lysine N-methyltransferase SETMAR